MTIVPLPASPCLRIRLNYTQSDSFDAGSRFYVSYAGAAPTAANCETIAGDVAAAWNTNIVAQVTAAWALTEVDVLDIATYAGLSGVWTGNHTGTNAGPGLPAQVATNVEFDIARRYRGGKPRMFWPPPSNNELVNESHYNAAFIAGFNTAVSDFFTAVEAIAVGAVGALAHVNLSYYKGFTNIVNSSGRERAVPTYRSAALLDSVTGYATKGLLGSQRRRRAATTP